MSAHSLPRVLVVAGRHPNRFLGGGYICAWETALAMREHARVKVLTVAYPEHVRAIPDVIRLPNVPKFMYPLLFLVAGLPWLLRATAVHAHDRGGLLLGLVARLLGKRYAFTVYNGVLEKTRWSATPFLMKLDWLSARCANVVFVLSESSRQQVAWAYSLPREKLVVIGAGVHERFHAFRRNVSRRADSLLFAGRLDDHKGAARAIEVLTLVRPSIPTASLVVAGDGPLRQELQRLCRERGVEDAVTFLGAVPPEDMPAVYDRASVLLLPSAGESFGLVLVEAMARGAVPVLFEAAGRARVVQHGDNGVIVPKGDVCGMAAALCDLLKDKPLLMRLSDAGPAVAAAYRWRDVAKRCVDALDN